ncbi:MAG: DUF2490 domain-containing protein [Mucilaginibacter sp.]
MRKLLFILLLLFPALSFAQTVEHSMWSSFFNTTKFNNKWEMQYDMQFRSSNNVTFLKYTLFRPALLYGLDKNFINTIGLGYVLNDTYTHTSKPNVTEHDIYEQFIHKQYVGAIAITHRFRVEQRFIERPGNSDLFSQRFKYFIRAIIPLAKQKSTFKNGMYTALQNEIFVNLQNKDQLNGSMFDQNRAAAAIGYRFSTKFDMEVGYLNQFTKNATGSVSNNAAQLTFYTRF